MLMVYNHSDHNVEVACSNDIYLYVADGKLITRQNVYLAGYF